MASDVPSAFAFLHKVNLRSFGTTKRIWWPTERKGKLYTVEIPGVASPITAREAQVIGFVDRPQDAIIIHATKADFPYVPQGGDLFRWGEDNTGRKYEVISCAGMEDMHPHYRITATFASS